MKVLLITPLPPPLGGIARWSESFLKWSEGRFETTVVNNSLLNISGSPIARYLSQLKRTRNILKDLSGKIKKGDIDVAHVNSSCTKLGILRDYICVRMLYKKNIPVVFQCHCNIEDQLGKGKTSRKVFQKTISLTSKLLVLNSSSLKFAQDCGAENVCVCPNFIAKEKIATEPHTVKEKINTAVYIGHLYKDKGVDEVISLADKHPEIEFKLIGPMTKEYNETTVLPKNAVFTGPTDSDGVLKALDEADVFLLLSYSEGFSNAMLEAMARGVPVLASDVGAAADMIEDLGGRVVPAGDTESASRALEAMSDMKLREQMSRWNCNKALQHYESEAVMNKIKDYYLEIKKNKGEKDV